MIWFLNKKKVKKDKNASSAELAVRRYVEMSARDRKKLMKRVIRRASEEQLKILRKQA